MQTVNRRQWLKSAGLATGMLTILNQNLFSLNHVAPYQVDGDDDLLYADDKIIRLSANENPYGPSPYVREKITAAFDKACRYPSGEIPGLTKKIAEKEGVSPEHILVTVGSTEGLKIAALAYLQKGGELVAPEPTFEAMLNYAEACGAFVHRVPVNKELGIDLESMEKRCNADTKMVFVCNPNNPTGTILPADEMIHFCTKMANRTMVFSDEAYFDYINEKDYPSMTVLVKNDLNVIVSRTFSKVYGIAGLRIGYLIARPDIIKRLENFQVDNPNMLALAAAHAAMDEKEFYNFSLQKNNDSKKLITNTLDQLSLPYTQSHANFVFFKSGIDISEFGKKMLQHNIKVGRPFRPLLDWCRISTGKTEEMQAVVSALKKVYA
jgi:histidinol-phosphate aminotransferase